MEERSGHYKRDGKIFEGIIAKTKTEYTQPLILGIDTGSSKIGSAVVDGNNNVLYLSQIEVRKDNLSLSERVFVCDKCGYEIDRDLNASINLKNHGKSIA